MPSVARYLILPPEVSPFERAHLARMNRIALLFLVANVPLLMAVAAACGTGVLRALGFGALALVGPVVAYKTFQSPRAVSTVISFASMCIAGLLVHFGQGPMQIEMHFYFFVLIALLAVFANPANILVAAGTVALHHLTLFLLLPRSVFNYEASIWAVAVHAAFVVLESVAACFVARSFFDDVIGLEKIVATRTGEVESRAHELRVVLDHVEEGLTTASLDGTVSSASSAAMDRFFGAPTGDHKIWSLIGNVDPTAGEWIRLGWQALLDDLLPVELVLYQLPKRVNAGGRVLEMAYRPVLRGERMTDVLVIATDITSRLEREKVHAEQRDILNVLDRMVGDRAGVLGFIEEAAQLVRLSVDETTSDVDARRHLHTLKGTAALYGLTTFADVCHSIETNVEQHGALTMADRALLSERWADVMRKLGSLTGKERLDLVEVERAEIDALATAVSRGAPRADLRRFLEDWTREPTRIRLGRVAEQARALATALDKPGLAVKVEANHLRLSAERWASFWSAFAHVVRNAVDHGIETPEERRLAGKPPEGSLVVRTRLDRSDFVIELEDDGRGVGWPLVRERAMSRGLPCRTQEDLVEALFTDGLSTKDGVTAISGRGVGMGAVRAACAELGASISLTSVVGEGTTIAIRCPVEAMGKAREGAMLRAG